MDYLQALLWFQFAYTAWQFIRAATLMQIPYMLLSFLWNGKSRRGSFVFKERSIRRQADWSHDNVGHDALSFINIVETTNVYNTKFLVTFTYENKKYVYLLRPEVLANLSSVLTDLKAGHVFVKDLVEIFDNFFFARHKGTSEVFDHALKNKAFMNDELRAFVNYTSTDTVSDNLIKSFSLLSLFLSTKNLLWPSAFVTTGVIVIDLLSYWALLLYRKIRYILFLMLKWIIKLVMCGKGRRLFQFLGGLNAHFKCADQTAGVPSFQKVEFLYLPESLDLSGLDCQLSEDQVACIPVEKEGGRYEYSMHGCPCSFEWEEVEEDVYHYTFDVKAVPRMPITYRHGHNREMTSYRLKQVKEFEKAQLFTVASYARLSLHMQELWFGFFSGGVMDSARPFRLRKPQWFIVT